MTKEDEMPEFDLVIRGGTIVDGTGIPRYRADLAIKDGRVAMISGRITGAEPRNWMPAATSWRRVPSICIPTMTRS